MGELLGRLLKPPAVVELRSDLGGGKTTFAKGLARGAGSSDSVTSPTFTLSQVYGTKSGGQIIHHDFYRLDEPGIMANELAESLADGNAISVIEWGGSVRGILPEDRLTVEFKPSSAVADERQISFIYRPNNAGLIKTLETQWAKSRP